MNKARTKCPQCGEKTGIRIVYGYPSETLFEEVGRDEIVLGGCVHEIDAPNRHCLSCGHDWLTGSRMRQSGSADELRVEDSTADVWEDKR